MDRTLKGHYKSNARRLLNLVVFLIIGFASPLSAKCNAKFLNPISEVCWDCIFPISVGAIDISFGSSRPDTDNQSFPLCFCPGIPPIPGLSIGIWEPARLVDVSNETGCFVNMGFDMDFGLFSRGKTTVSGTEGLDSGSKWHVHYYYYPLLSFIGTAIDGLCLENTAFDVAWMSEVDPLWMDAELSLLINPEAALFANPIAQAACAADCVRASSGHLPFDQLFWCDGCNGPLYPVTGDANQHVGGVQAAAVVSGKILSRMHRMGLARKTASSSAQCSAEFAPIIPKSQYRRQITRPIAKTSGRYACGPIGASAQLYDSGREYVYGGESFGFLYWRKRNCCTF
ncbi:MAG: TraU family protein [Pseudoruegeria sp.]